MDGEIVGRFLKSFLKDQPGDHLLVLSAWDHQAGTREYKRFPVQQVAQATHWCVEQVEMGRSVFYKTALLKPDSIRMIKENFQDYVLWLWADLDEMDPATLPVKPTFLIESSPGRYQALWRLERRIDKYDAEQWCRAIAAYGDSSGWDIGQELRVPGTNNFKYESRPDVRVLEFVGSPLITVELLGQAGLVPVDTPRLGGEAFHDVPEPWDGPTPPFTLEEALPHKRSVALWAALNRLRDEGWTKEDAYNMMWWSPLNKYRLDGRAPRDLWRDVEKCWSQPRVDDENLQIAIPKPKPKIDLSASRQIGWWPHLCQMAIDTFRGPTLFTDETIALMFLSSYSACFPEMRVHGSNLGLWTLLLGKQAAGKSTLIQSLSHMAMAATPSLRLVTSGSPEGIMETVAGGPTLLSFEEYSEQLKQMAKRDGYAVTNKEVYSRMFDGAPLGHATRKKGISTGQTFAVMTASTNADTWRQYGDPEDMANGYLSRFVVLADDLVDRSLNRSNIARDTENLSIAAGERASIAFGVTRVELSNMVPTMDEESLGYTSLVPGVEISEGDHHFLQYQADLESLWERSFNLDDATPPSAFDVPPGRTLTKARKLAALLELSESSPQIAHDKLYVRERNSRLAIELANRSMVWAQRAIDWLQESTESRHVERIKNTLEGAHPEWMRPWDIAVRLRGLRAFEVKSLLRTLHESGIVERRQVKRGNNQTSELWRIVK